MTHIVGWCVFGLVVSCLLAWGCGVRAKISIRYFSSAVLKWESEQVVDRVVFGGCRNQVGVDAFSLQLDVNKSLLPVPRDRINDVLQGKMVHVDGVHVHPRVPSWAPQEFDHVSRRIYIAQGWPFRCVTCSIGTPGPIKGGINIGKGNPSIYILAYAPIWPGLLANTAIFGTGGFLLTGGHRRLRRGLRRRAGRCPDCGYDLAGTTGQPCPECGRDDGEPSDP